MTIKNIKDFFGDAIALRFYTDKGKLVSDQNSILGNRIVSKSNICWEDHCINVYLQKKIYRRK